MNTAKKTDRIIILVLLIMAAGIVARVIYGSRSGPNSNLNPGSKSVTYRDYNGKKSGF